MQELGLQTSARRGACGHAVYTIPINFVTRIGDLAGPGNSSPGQDRGARPRVLEQAGLDFSPARRREKPCCRSTLGG